MQSVNFGSKVGSCFQVLEVCAVSLTTLTRQMIIIVGREPELCWVSERVGSVHAHIHYACASLRCAGVHQVHPTPCGDVIECNVRIARAERCGTGTRHAAHYSCKPHLSGFSISSSSRV